jgi:hypothetical protein
MIQFSQEYNNQRNVRKEKKRSNKNTRCNGVGLKNAYVSGTQPPTIEVEPKY